MIISWPPRFFVVYSFGWVVARLAMVWSRCWYSRMVVKWKGRLPSSSNNRCLRRHLANSGVDARIELGGSGSESVSVSARNCWTEVWSFAGSCETSGGRGGGGGGGWEMHSHCMVMSNRCTGNVGSNSSS